jgi:alpha-beta hydrolase superfamily lysophospholipase
MIEEAGTSTTPSGATLFFRRWSPNQPPTAILAIVHGFGEHSELYNHLGQFFTDRGFAVVSLDLRGHGKSAGARGFVRHWNDYLEDVTHLVDLAYRPGGAPLYLVGHSMGGLIAIEYALRHPERLGGLVVMGPALGEVGVPRILVWLSRALSRIWPSFSLDTRINSAAMSRDPAAVARLEADPLVHGRGTARLGTEFFEAIKRVRAGAATIAVPILMQHGDADTVAHPDGTRQFFSDITFADKQLMTYPGGFHNLFVDLNWKDVLDDIHLWITRHLPS